MHTIEQRIEKQIRRLILDNATVIVEKKEDNIYLAKLDDYAFYAEYKVEVVDNQLILRTVYMYEYDEAEIINKKLSEYITEIRKLQEN